MNTPTINNCKNIENDGQALVKTSPLNLKAVQVWSKETIETGLIFVQLSSYKFQNSFNQDLCFILFPNFVEMSENHK